MESLVDQKQMDWHEWSCHTNFSFLYGASHPEESIKRAISLGYKSLCITDYDGVYGLARAYRFWKKYKAESKDSKNFLKLHYGVEFHLRHDHDKPILEQDTLILVAKSHEGYRKICELSTLAHIHGKKHPRVAIEEILKHAESSLLCIQPMRGIWHGKDSEEIVIRLKHLKEAFGENFALSVHKVHLAGEDRLISTVGSYAQAFNLPVLQGQDSFFHTRERKLLCDIQFAIRKNQPVSELRDHLFANTERYLAPLAELKEKFASYAFFQQALLQGQHFAEGIQFCFSELSYSYPKEMIPEGRTTQSWLHEIVWKSANQMYANRVPEKIHGLIAKELVLVESLGFADYFLTVWDIVRWAREQKILCQGRGSAANSAICYVLGITSVDPSQFDLLFERFISAERGDPPDIDVDFEHERREEVIQYIYSRYGRNRAAMVANVIRFQRKGALRSVGKALGFQEEFLSELSKTLKMSRRHTREQTLQRFLGQKLEQQGETSGFFVQHEIAFENEESLVRVWQELAEELIGFPRHLGIHSGGFMIAEHHLNQLVGLEPATMQGRSIVQWDKEDIEALNFFKIDILALGMLSAVRGAFKFIEDCYDHKLSLAHVPQEDELTYRMIQKADTVGTFQIESRAQMSMLPRLRPKTFYDLVIEVAIIRPGPIQGGLINPYLRRRWGEDPVTYPHPSLEPILKRTLGVPIFQEQVMRIAMAVGGFSGGEADELRRMMGSWQIKGDLGPMMKKLALGMKRFGIAQKFIDQTLEQMQAFAHYGFPESHANSFAMIAYVSCWVKCHYPNAFFAALLNAQPMGFYSPHTLIQQAKRDGVEVLPVCVRRSEYWSTLEPIAAKKQQPGKVVPLHETSQAVLSSLQKQTLAEPAFKREKRCFAIRLGLHMVRELREDAAQSFVEKRKVANWGSLEDYLNGSQCFYKSDWTALARADAFAEFGISRRDMLWKLAGFSFRTFADDVEESLLWPEESREEKLGADFTSFQTSLTDHPVTIARESRWTYELSVQKLIDPIQMIELPRNRWVDVFGLVIVRQSPPTAKGMVFITLEDEHGSFNLVFTPQVYKRWATDIEAEAFLCVGGILQKQIGASSILVKKVYTSNRDKAPMVVMEKQSLFEGAEFGYSSRDFH